MVLGLGLFSGLLHAADKPLKVGTTAAFAIPLETAVAEADKQGLKVELVEFTDWIAPNVSLASGDIDVNYFQHIPFLETAKVRRSVNPLAPTIPHSVADWVWICSCMSLASIMSLGNCQPEPHHIYDLT